MPQVVTTIAPIYHQLPPNHLAHHSRLVASTILATFQITKIVQTTALVVYLKNAQLMISTVNHLRLPVILPAQPVHILLDYRLHPHHLHYLRALLQKLIRARI